MIPLNVLAGAGQLTDVNVPPVMVEDVGPAGYLQ